MVTDEQEEGRVRIRQMHTGVPGLDEILGGGLPEPWSDESGEVPEPVEEI